MIEILRVNYCGVRVKLRIFFWVKFSRVFSLFDLLFDSSGFEGLRLGWVNSRVCR